MSYLAQLFWGGGIAAMCCVFHVVWIYLTIAILQFRRMHYKRRNKGTSGLATLLIALTMLFISHAVQILAWAMIWLNADVLPDFESAFYFSFVTYTAVGYGDLVLGEGTRIFGVCAAFGGLLAFGLSTALLVALLSRTLDRVHS